MSYKNLIQKLASLRPVPAPSSDSHDNLEPLPLTSWQKLDRFLSIGSEKGIYQSGDPPIQADKSSALIELLVTEGPEVLEKIRICAGGGGTVREEPSLFALAAAASFGSPEGRAAALASLPSVCRTSSQLFQFISHCDAMRGWGRGFRKGVAAWYSQTDPDELASQVLRSQCKEGWAHRDVLRLSHPKPVGDKQRSLFKWMTGGPVPPGFPSIKAFEELQVTEDPKRAAELIYDHRIPREKVPAELLQHPIVWEALMEHMTHRETLQNLANLTLVGLLEKGSASETRIANRLKDPARLRRSNSDLITLMEGAAAYTRSSKTLPKIIEALEEAGDLLFDQIEPHRRKVWVGLDVSSSMVSGSVSGSSLSPAQVALALAYTLSRSSLGSRVSFLGEKIKGPEIPSGGFLASALSSYKETMVAGSDLSLPIQQALSGKHHVDCFVLVTDASTPGRLLSSLAKYRTAINPTAQVMLVSLNASHPTLPPHGDGGIWECLGWDRSAMRFIDQVTRGVLE